MAERGRVIREVITSNLEQDADALSEAMGISVNDFQARGKDGTGRKARVPWVGFNSSTESPSPTEGFYVVYLFGFPGGEIFLSLNQGTTDFNGSDFARKSEAELQARVDWARHILGNSWVSNPLEPLRLGTSAGELAEGYELGDIGSVKISNEDPPSDEEVKALQVQFAAALGQLYAAQQKAPLPFQVPEVDEAARAAALSAGKRPSVSGPGFLQSQAEREVIEERAVTVARASLEAEGWTIHYEGKGGKKPYDLRGERDGSQDLFVEVKGTTSDGDKVQLTSGEVAFHQANEGNSSLCVVRRIRLIRGPKPRAEGGELLEVRPWMISESSLSPISFTYLVPSDEED